MTTTRGFFGVAFAALLLAGCGGGGSHSSLPATVAADSAARTTESTTTITPTLYVSGLGTVYVYDLAASGTTAPNKILGAFYNGSDPSATNIAGIASNRKGDLMVLQNYGGTEGPSAPSCQVWTYTANATGGLGATPTKAYQCGPGVFYGQAIQYGPNGEVDVLDTIDNAGATGWHVERFFPSQTSQYSTQVLNLTKNVTYTGLAAGAQGNIYTAYTAATSHIDKYQPLLVGNASPSGGANDAGNLNNFGPAAAGRGSIYVAAQDKGTTQWSVSKFNTAFGQTQNFIAAYPLGTNITAMIVDASGNLYVGTTTPGTGTSIDVYNSGGGLLYTLDNPVRKANALNYGQAVLTGIAIAQ